MVFSVLDLLEASERLGTLDRPVQAGVSNSDAWPAKEHDSLKRALLEEGFFTELMPVLQMIGLDLKSEIKTIAYDTHDAVKYRHHNLPSITIYRTTY